MNEKSKKHSNGKYPECDKMLAAKECSQVIGEFLEWLQSGEADPTVLKRPVHLAALGVETTYWDELAHEECDLPEDEWETTDELRPFQYTTEELLAKFFGIDLAKVEKEKCAMLEEQRRLNAQT